MEDEIEIRHAGTPRRNIAITLVVLIAVAAIIVIAVSIYSVELGEVAVVVDPLTQSVGKPLVGPTYGFKPPWAYVVKEYVGVEAVDMFYEPPRDYPAVDALTRDGVKVSVDLTIRYQLIPENFDDLVRAYPRLNHEEDFIVATSRQVAREIVATFPMTAAIENRELMARDIEGAIESALKKDPLIGHAIKLLGVNMRDIILPNEILSAINEKVAAQQRAIKAEYERQATLVEANASAQKTIIEAEAQARALKLVAEAQAESIMSLAIRTGVNASTILNYYFYLQAIERAAASGRATFIMTTQGVTPLVGVPSQP